MALPPLNCSPVFLIGAARSGTKFLRDTLSVDPSVCTIPFDINFVWRRGNDSLAHDVLTPEMASYSIGADLRSRLPKMAGAKAGEILLEKTVSNTLRLPFLFKVFPEARFIHLVRDGRCVVESVNRLWDQPTSLQHKLKKLRYFPVTNLAYAGWFLRNSFTAKKTERVWGTRYEGIYNDLSQHSRLLVCARQWVKCIESAERDFQLIDSSRVHTVRYESLVSDSGEMSKLCHFLGLAEDSSAMDRYDRTVRHDTSGKWRGKWSKVDQEMLQVEMGATLSRLGYGAVTNPPQ